MKRLTTSLYNMAHLIHLHQSNVRPDQSQKNREAGYLGSFIGKKTGQILWILEKVAKWTEGASQLATITVNRPH